ncbi:MAG: hypothetical protein GEU98_05975 [Pseudonocardiaceae bacterium]|nr:hypothetical protein [Pseudonocardiaceae bacterium]
MAGLACTRWTRSISAGKPLADRKSCTPAGARARVRPVRNQPEGRTPVTIGEELLLLALDDEEGTRQGDGTKVGYATVGAHLLELTMARRLDMEGKKIVVRDPGPVGEPSADHVLNALAAKSPRKPGDWLWSLATKSVEATTRSLMDKGFVRQTDRKVLGLFTVKRYPAADGSAESDARGRLAAVLLGGQQPDPRTAALVGMLHAADLAKVVFPDADRKAITKRAKEIAEDSGKWANDAVAATIEETNVAVFAAVLAAVAVTSVNT